jgi:hypothetical protein
MYAYLKNHDVRMKTAVQRDAEDHGENDDDGCGSGACGAEEVGEECH